MPTWLCIVKQSYRYLKYNMHMCHNFKSSVFRLHLNLQRIYAIELFSLLLSTVAHHDCQSYTLELNN